MKNVFQLNVSRTTSVIYLFVTEFEKRDRIATPLSFKILATLDRGVSG